jgi:hypothetical protein
MPLDVVRLQNSETWAIADGWAAKALVNLWTRSWHQVPAGSLPDDDNLHRAWANVPDWESVRNVALRGFVKCSDGRLYHRVICEKVAELEVRFSRVALCKPRHANGHGLPASISLSMVDVRETSKPEDGSEPIHWRLLTTHEVKTLYQARRIIELYRLRWIIEEYFHTLKTAGFDIEVADIGAPQVMIKFVTAVAVAAVTVMQLVKARDGTTGQKLAVVFDPADQPILEAVSAQLEGKTVLQQNPHPKGSLAFAAWVMGRLGGWTGYYGKPGPKVMRRGFEAFQRIKFGAMLGPQNV